ncbi:NF041680 family putative transposase [Cryptosporangium phraense]|uniref:Transposase n=1 Tax=Cryptosporangium phraense TaxID=2593070 RepID=A0A545AZF4_9ACTN|nr:NF041680 family putative transposase [Cryptosporangium phraense]TQS46720.1 transposase [Cryptosporangium phraense]
MSSVPDAGDRVESLERLAGFREEFYGCLTRRADTLFELVDAVLCADGPVRTLAGLSLAPEHRRGHGALYDAVNNGHVELGRLRRAVAGLPLPRAAGGRIVLAVDVSPWLRPEAHTSPRRLFCHVTGQTRASDQRIPGWPYSIVAALETGRTSWTAILDAVRLGPADDDAAVTAAQLREVIDRLTGAGHWQPGDPDILIVADSGYDCARLTHDLADLPVTILGRIRADRVLRLPAPPRPPGTWGRPRRHGGEFRLADPATWPQPACHTSTATSRYGDADARSWNRLHPRLTHRAAWIDHNGPLPVLEGTLIRLQVEHVPSGHDPKPIWLWCSAVDLDAGQVDRLWQAYLRRFDLEHTFRLLKQTLGWTRPRLREPEAADTWTWLLIAAHTQLRLARDLVTDLRLPWEKPAMTGRLSPARVRRGFRNLRPKTPLPARAPKPGRPGPGRPPGRPNQNRAPHHHVGKTVLRARTLTQRQKPEG